MSRYPAYKIDKKYPHKRLKRAGARFVFHKEKKSPFWGQSGPSRWLAFIHIDCDNGDGGVLYEFVRDGSGWRCSGFGRLRYASNPGRDLFTANAPA